MFFFSELVTNLKILSQDFLVVLVEQGAKYTDAEYENILNLYARSQAVIDKEANKQRLAKLKEILSELRVNKQTTVWASSMKQKFCKLYRLVDIERGLTLAINGSQQNWFHFKAWVTLQVLMLVVLICMYIYIYVDVLFRQKECSIRRVELF